MKSDANTPEPETEVDPSASESVGLLFLRQMLEIRAFEDAVQLLFTSGSVRGSTHLCQGQEAVSVGGCSVMQPGDTMTCSYRGHGAVLAAGAPMDRAFGEILGKANGLCGGKGGSMHLTDVSVGAFGSFAIVGAHLPISVGLAFAARYAKSSEVAICFFGDGATNIGAFHEALNLAGIWKLPVLFVCENNLYGEYSPIASTTPVERLADRAAAYGMPGVRIDGNDVFAVRDAVAEAADRGRRGDGPSLVEAMTYRQSGHSRSDPAKYRPAGELDEWLERDPIKLLRDRLAQNGTSAEDLDRVENDVRADVEQALKRARSWPDSHPDQRLTNVFA